MTAADRNAPPQGDSPIVSVVIETMTADVSGDAPLTGEGARAFLEQSGFRDGEIEYILVGPGEADVSGFGRRARAVAVPNGGYYEYKNAGFQAARGKYVAFWDGDCRPSPDYLELAASHLDGSPGLLACAGVSSYDGASWFSELNTILSFGFLHQYRRPESLGAPEWMQAHNVVIRRDGFPPKPFGDYAARMDGDNFCASYAALNGLPPLVEPRMRIFHEDPSFSFSLLLERHLREVFGFVSQRPPLTRARLLAAASRSALARIKTRFARLRTWGPHFGWSPLETAAAAPVLGFYAVLNLAALAALAAKPSLLDRWLRYQFGGEWTRTPDGKSVYATVPREKASAAAGEASRASESLAANRG